MTKPIGPRRVKGFMLTKYPAVLGLIVTAVLGLRLLTPHPSLAATTKTAPIHRLFYRPIAGSDPSTSAFVIVSPDGYPSVTTLSKLHWMIERLVKAPETLQWEPSDMRTGVPEPLDAADEVKALREFCERKGVKFVIVPAG